MNENDQTEVRPCIRGCVWDNLIEGEAPRPKAARHGGQLCDSCYYRMKHALRMIPDMMANMRVQMVPAGIANYESERVGGGSEGAPAPFRVGALDASDALFAKLVSWIDALSEEMHAAVPSIRTWMGFSEVQGSRPVSAVAAHDQAAQLTSWFLVRLEEIAGSTSALAFHDDICWGWDDSLGVYKLTGQYGVEPRPLRAADKRECPLCGHREVFVKWPDKLDPDVAILCGRCKWVAEPEKYGHYAELFKNA
jgi:hypothetical protein